MTFDAFFVQATGQASGPYPYQRRLAECEDFDLAFPDLLDIPTGLGKTAAVVLGWVWRRRFAMHVEKAKREVIRGKTPRRLVYCLPMRVLVEQTRVNAVFWLDRLGLLAGNAQWDKTDDGMPARESELCEYRPAPESDQSADGWASLARQADPTIDDRRIAVHLLMGGEDRTDWAGWPERDAILIGTQDMLLSRALNRGYAARRARWPVEFGLLNNDCLWVLDEVQLMGSGLATTAQLDAFAKRLWKPAKPSQFLWMSATMGNSFLQTRDRRDWGLTDATTLGLEAEDVPRVQTRLQAPKTLDLIRDRPKAAKILEAHAPGRISLVVLNTVSGAKSVYKELQDELRKTPAKNRPKRAKPDICLLHSRFRPIDRKRQMKVLQGFLKKPHEDGAVPDSDGLIVVSTQVVEAGLDLSAARLWSEIAPWPSIIQRLGRLNREGSQPEASASFWMPKADEGNKGDASPNARRIGPYEKKALDVAKKLLNAVIAKQAEGLAYRESLDAVLATKESRETMRVEPDVVIRPDDFFELFSTEPDLAGGFTNVSQFVRDQDRNVDVHVFWRDFNPKKVKQPDESSPEREELCSVPFFEFRQFLGKAGVAWEWNFDAGRWESRRSGDIQPGMTLLLPKSAGGYHRELGWTGDGSDDAFDVMPGSDAEDSLDADYLSGSKDWIALPDHLRGVEAAMVSILRSLGILDTPLGEALIVAATWHDRGKSVDKWQDRAKDYATKACQRLEKMAQKGAIPGFPEVAVDWQKRLQSKDGVAEIWAKFPDIRAASLDPRLNLSDSERAGLSRKLRVAFRPGMRHEAASALAAWESWLGEHNGVTALAVYLIASHHGKVRTVLRSRRESDDVFGVTDGMALSPVPGSFPESAPLRTDAKYVGAFGNWDDASAFFTLTSPSWLQMVSELLGPTHEGQPATCEVVPQGEPRQLGPLALSYLESLLRAADVRASRQSEKGASL